MCIARCHIIFWGDKNYNKFGVNVIQRHSLQRQRYEPSSQKTSTTLRWLQRYDELRQSIEMMCIITRNVGLLPWVVYVSQGFPIISMIVCTSSQLFCYGGTCWWNILTLSYEQQRCHSSITSNWWTIYVCELSVTGWTASSRHLYCFDVRCYCFNYYWWNIFRHPSIIFFICNLTNEHSSSLHSSRRRLPHQDFS